MPLNRSTLIRISSIDRCLQNRYRRWTINDLIDACTDALAEFEGRSNPVSRRTFQNDLALMRSDRLGYNALIVVRDNKYYEYDDIGDKAQKVVINVDSHQAPYVESKPFHKSQKVEQRFGDGSVKISLKVIINNELERLILGYGEHVEVIAPNEFRARVAESVRIAASHYDK